LGLLYLAHIDEFVGISLSIGIDTIPTMKPLGPLQRLGKPNCGVDIGRRICAPSRMRAEEDCEDYVSVAEYSLSPSILISPIFGVSGCVIRTQHRSRIVKGQHPHREKLSAYTLFSYPLSDPAEMLPDALAG
jgi:hypothetical protein